MLPSNISPASPEASYLQEVLLTQAALQPVANDAFSLLTRYVFIPFWSRELSLEDMRNLGGMPTLEAGYIIPIIKYQTREPAYEEIAKVTIDPFVGGYVHTPYGVSEEKLVNKAPREVVEAILEVFNREHDTGNALDNGVCEIDVLRGNKDFDAEFAFGKAESLSALNRFCLPERYTAARKQIEQLRGAVANAPSPLYKAVAERLLRSTLQSVTWAESRYRLVEKQVEAGKVTFYPIDEAVFAWLERPEPRRRSNLEQGQMGQAQAQPSPRATVQCLDCGNEANLLPDNSMPKKGCLHCGSATFGRAEVAASPVASESEQRELSQSLGEKALEQRQNDMKQRQEKRR